MMWYILFLILTFAVGFFYGHGNKPPDDEEQEQETAVDFFRLCEIIEDMNSTKNKLKQIDRLILDLELTDENNTQTVNLQWDDSTKSDNHYSVEVKNSDNFLIKEMKNEQEKLRSHLLECVDEIERLRSYGNGYGNDKKGVK